MAGSKKVTVGYKYLLGMHMVLCRGPIDRVLKLRVDERDAWVGESTGGPIVVDAPGLFGGESREGGVQGTIDFESGVAVQPRNSYLQSVLGAAIPAFRGVAALVLRQVYLGMNPFLKPWSVLAQRTFVRQDGLAQWYPEQAAIEGPSTSVNVNAEFSDSFQTLVAYTATIGSIAQFSLALVDGVAALDVAAALPPGAQIRRSVPPISGEAFSLRFRLADAGLNSPIMTLRDAAGNRIFEFQASGSAGIANPGTPQFFLFTQEGGSVGAQALQPGIWHTVELALFELDGEWTLKITRDDTGQLVGSTGNVLFGPAPEAATLEISNALVSAGAQGQFAHFFMIGKTRSGSDMNPAHLLRECLTDPDWGMGEPDGQINDTAFRAAADTLSAEGFGMSLLWDRQQPIGEFMQAVLNHIDATLYSDADGRWVLKLIRADYDVLTLLVLDRGNVAKVENLARPQFGELTTSVTVNYVDGSTQKAASVTANDTALAQAQGVDVHTALPYPGITSASIAGRVAARELRALSMPLVSCTIFADRRASRLKQGDPFILDWPEFGLDSMVMRVVSIALGDGRSNVVRISAAQDVFATPQAAPVAAGLPGAWVDPVTPPQPSPASIAFELPYYELVQIKGQTTVNAELAAVAEAGQVAAAAASPGGGSANALLSLDSGLGFADAAPMDYAPFGVLASAIGKTDLSVTLSLAQDLSIVSFGTHAQLGEEIVAVDAVVGNVVSVRRGVLDTVPVAHAAGEVMLFWDEFSGAAEQQVVLGESVGVKVRTVTGLGSLAVDAAPLHTVQLNARAIRPYPPGLVTINGAAWPQQIVGPLNLSWAHRDRQQQTSGALIDHSFGNVGPEPGTTYTARVLDGSGPAVLIESAGIADSSAVLPLAHVGPVTIELLSVRDGWESMQRHVHASVLDAQPTGAAVVLLLHGEGLDGGTVLVDSGFTSHAVTAGGAVTTSTAQFKYGAASISCPGAAADLVSVANSADFDFGALDFTVEAWIRPASIGPMTLLGNRPLSAPDNGWVLTLTPTGQIEFRAWDAAGADAVALTTGPAVAANQWAHVAVSRALGATRIFVNGAVLATSAVNYEIGPSLAALVTRDSAVAGSQFAGFIDELRVLRGVGLYTSAFDAPTGAFPPP